jgi:integrase
MPSIGFYLDVPNRKYTDIVQKMELEAKIKACKKNRTKIPTSLLNDRETSIYLILTINRTKMIKVKTEFRIYPKYWDFNKKLPNSYGRGNMELEHWLLTLKADVLLKYMTVIKDCEELSMDTLKKEITGIVKRTDSIINKNNFFEVFDLYLKSQPNYSYRTIQKYNTLRALFEEFESTSKCKIAFDNINSQFQADLRKFLIENKKYLNNTIDKVFTNLKTILKWCNEEGYSKNLSYQKFTYYKDETEVLTLSQELFKKLYDFIPQRQSLIEVKDVFIFQCLVGQRFGDLKTLGHEDIKNGIWYLYQRKGKRTNVLEIPIHKYGLEILDKYKNETNPLPVLSNTKYNEHLKELFEEAKIDEPVKRVRYSGNNRIEEVVPFHKLISTHSARRSAVNILAGMGVQVEVIQAITGHNDINVLLKHYRKVSLEEKKNAIDKIQIGKV